MASESEDLPTAAVRMGFENWGRITGLEMILRALVAERAAKADNPVEFLETFRAELVASMVRQGRDNDPVEALLIEHAEGQINDVFDNVKQRFGD